MFRWVTDVERGDWIADRLGPFGGWVGSVVPRGFDAYARVLHRASDGASVPDREVTAGFWEGSGWQGAVWLTSAGDEGRAGLPTGAFIDPAVLEGPILDLPNRRYFLVAGTLDDLAALAIGAATADVTPFNPGSRTPSLLWPDDHAWCVATEVDLDSTLVAGSRQLIDAVLADETLEALEVVEADSLMVDGDQVNP